MWDPQGTNIYEEDGSWKYLSWRHQINLGVIFASCQSQIKGIVAGLRCVCGGGILRPSGNSSYLQRCEQWQGWYPCCQSSSFSQLLASTMAFAPPSSVHQHQQCCWFSIHPFICISSPQRNFSSFRNSNLNLSPKTLPPISAAASQWPSASAAAYHLMMRSVHRWIVHHCRRYHPRRWCIIHIRSLLLHKVDKTVKFFCCS